MTNTVQFITVAYNRPAITAEQIRLFRKYIVDANDQPMMDGLWIVDNSDPGCAKDIAKLCADANVRYFRTRHTPANPSVSHGLALNWAVKHTFRNAGRFIVLIDHDMLPMRKFHVSPKMMENNVYGLHQTNNGHLYIWPGYLFFDRRLLQDHMLDFLPESGKFDTGGRLFTGPVKVRPDCGAKEEVVTIQGGDDPQNDTYSIIDDRWLHWRNPQATWKPGDCSRKDAVLWEKVRAL